MSLYSFGRLRGPERSGRVMETTAEAMMRKTILVIACAAVAACGPADEPDTAQIGTPEREVRDSIIGQSKLPGAKAVESARDVQTTSKERAAMLDSIQ